MIDPQRKTSNQIQYGKSLYLVCSTLMVSAAMSSAVAKDSAFESITLATTQEVSFTETIVQTSGGDLGKIAPLGDILVTVVRGDSLSSILRENLGSLSALGEVTRYNNLDTPDSLEPGQEILIPSSLFPLQSDTQLVQSVNSPADPESATQTTQTTQATQTEEQYVLVDLTELATDPETAVQTAESEEEQFVLVDLTELATDPETAVQTAVQTTESEEPYVVVDLTEINAKPDRRITVNRGDSLSSILRENLGSLSALREVARYNGLATPDVLEPGQIILIPGNL